MSQVMNYSLFQKELLKHKEDNEVNEFYEELVKRDSLKNTQDIIAAKEKDLENKISQIMGRIEQTYSPLIDEVIKETKNDPKKAAKLDEKVRANKTIQSIFLDGAEYFQLKINELFSIDKSHFEEKTDEEIQNYKKEIISDMRKELELSVNNYIEYSLNPLINNFENMTKQEKKIFGTGIE